MNNLRNVNLKLFLGDLETPIQIRPVQAGWNAEASPLELVIRIPSSEDVSMVRRVFEAYDLEGVR